MGGNISKISEATTTTGKYSEADFKLWKSQREGEERP